MKQPREKKEEPKWTAWYCKECDTVIYQASQSDVNKHMVTHKVSSQKEPEAWEDKLDQWWLEHEQAFAVPVAVTRDDVAIFIRTLLSSQRTQTIEEIKKLFEERIHKDNGYTPTKTVIDLIDSLK